MNVSSQIMDMSLWIILQVYLLFWPLFLLESCHLSRCVFHLKAIFHKPYSSICSWSDITCPLTAVDVRERGDACNEGHQAMSRSSTCRQPCFCHLASEIGFDSTAVTPFVLHQRFIKIAPYLTADFPEMQPEIGQRDLQSTTSLVNKVHPAYDMSAYARSVMYFFFLFFPFLYFCFRGIFGPKPLFLYLMHWLLSLFMLVWRRDRLMLSHSPLPHMMTTVIEDTSTHSLQMLSSGSCGLVTSLIPKLIYIARHIPRLSSLMPIFHYLFSHLGL